MNKLVTGLFSAVVIFGCASLASAQDFPPGGGPPPGGGQMGGGRFQMPSFSELDKNKDKKISRDEFPKNFPPQMFDRLDENKDGFIDETEWNNAMSRRGGAGGPGRFGESFMKALDANGDGKISREEFAKIVALFDILDKDKNGELSQEELGQFFGAVNQMASELQNKATGGINVEQLFTTLDKNKDGKITPDEMSDEKKFKALDLNKDGVITKEELTEALKKLADRRKSSTPQQNQ